MAEAKNAGTAELTIGKKTVKLPILQGTENEMAIDIRSLPQKMGGRPFLRERF